MQVAVYTRATSSVTLSFSQRDISSALFFLHDSRTRRFTLLRFMAWWKRFFDTDTNMRGSATSEDSACSLCTITLKG